MKPVFVILHTTEPMLEVGAIDNRGRARMGVIRWTTASKEQTFPPIGGELKNGKLASWLQQMEREWEQQDVVAQAKASGKWIP